MTRPNEERFFRVLMAGRPLQLAAGEIHVALACVDDQTPFEPTAHIFWEARVPWFPFTDDLPKADRDAKDLRKYQALPRTP